MLTKRNDCEVNRLIPYHSCHMALSSGVFPQEIAARTKTTLLPIGHFDLHLAGIGMEVHDPGDGVAVDGDAAVDSSCDDQKRQSRPFIH